MKTNYTELDKALLLVAKRVDVSINTLFISGDLLKLCRRAYTQLNELHNLIDNDMQIKLNDRLIDAIQRAINKL